MRLISTLPPDKTHSRLPGVGAGRGATFTKGISCSAFWQRGFLVAPVLDCLQLEIILMPQWHILGVIQAAPLYTSQRHMHKHTHLTYCNTYSGSPYLQVPHAWIQPATDQKYLGKKKKNSRKFQNGKLKFVAHQQLFAWYLHCIYSYLNTIYIVLGIISNLEMI